MTYLVSVVLVTVCLFLPQLFIRWVKKLFTPSNRVKSFKLVVYDLPGQILDTREGSGNEWRENQTISPMWQINSALFSLEEEWAYVIEKRLSEYQTEVTGYDTCTLGSNE